MTKLREYGNTPMTGPRQNGIALRLIENILNSGYIEVAKLWRCKAIICPSNIIDQNAPKD